MNQQSDSGGSAGLLREADFVARFGAVYEHSAWVAEAVYARHGGDTGNMVELATAMAEVVEEAGHEAQLALIRAHPDLAGRAAVGGGLTADSKAEQASAGLDQCTPAEYGRLRALNSAYRARFGFPFILAVRGRTRAEIIAAFEERLGNDAETEFRTALDQIHIIARLRLRAIAGEQ